MANTPRQGAAASNFSDGGFGIRNRSHRNFTVHTSFEVEPGGSVLSPPVISNVLPAPGTELDPEDLISFDMTDVLPGIARIYIWASLAGTLEPTLVYDGATFYGGFASESSVTEITDGYHFVLGYEGGWPGDISALTIKAFDEAGALLE